ncbi:hypothetical protein [Vibrio atypicus]|uniref:hypothetical protein n=1 Tax=Vibrio atypicus TaxID=558271 RepID=UPI001358E652|nr:hypothetical protein [Vibrio atypicus]
MLSLVSRIFEQCRLTNLPMVQIRPKAIAEPDIYQGDFDLLIKPDQITTFLKLTQRACAQSGNHLTIKQHKQDKINLVIWSKDTKHKVEFDIWRELDIKSPSLKKGSHISWGTLEKKNIIQPIVNGGYQLADDFSALFYLSHLQSKSKNLANSEVQTRLIYFSSLPNLTLSTKQLFTNVNSYSLNKANEALKEQGLIDFTLKHYLHTLLFRAFKSNAKKSGLAAVVGPDGVGKTTVIEQLEFITKGKYFRFKRLFRKSLLYKIITKQLSKKNNNNFAKNQLDDLQCRKLFWISLLPGYILTIRSRLGYKTICDRYFSDLLIQGSRFLDKEVILLPDAKKLMKLTPSPAVYIQLDAPSDVILSRKQEVSSHAIDKFRDYYFELALASGAPTIAYINTQHSIEGTRNAISRIGAKL